jgi:UDP-GlcNAc:undecaprenyl-phosphate GlcNAc-1-phosphate transferase
MANQSYFPQLVGIFAASLGVGVVLTPLVRSVARQFGLVDRPDGRRKIHKTPIPVAGGVAIFVASLLVLTGAYFVNDYWRQQLNDNWSSYGSLLVAAIIVVVVGVVDDYRGMRGRYKLLAQILAASIVVAGGVVVRSFTIMGHTWDLGILAIPLTIFWLLGAINSLNLIDGIDGLLGSVGLIICLTIGGMAFMNENTAAAFVAVALAGAVLAFLFYNFPPANIFLGDAGSMLIGLVVGTLAIHASLKGPALALAAPVALMVIPIFDTSAAIIRRKLTGRSIYATDRGHLHHVLLGSGLSNRKVLLTVGILSTFASAGAIFSLYQKNDVYAFGAIIAVGVFLLVSRLFGYTEFLLVKERLLALAANVRHGHQEDRVHQIQVHLQGSANWNELWRELTRSATDMKLKTLTLDVNAPAIHEGFHARWERVHKEHSEVPGFWRVEIPLTVQGQTVGRLDVIGLRDEESAWTKLAVLAKIVDDIEQVIAALLAAKDVPDALESAGSARPVKDLQLEKV